MIIGKEIDGNQNDHTLKVRACMENGQSESGCVPWQQTTMRYQEMRSVHKNEHKICYTHH